ncbi:hypothetical protein MJ1_0219 [Nanobdella aerobiophila]|uniref:Uncharacterized protein n=1 Tax=Nanobdella aerobiophila TaxID=2586965 RepID=A0A915SF09_9ARCH|nr:hypothetical protein MJ1_0219 [Nanobdella aerobiophila]
MLEFLCIKFKCNLNHGNRYLNGYYNSNYIIFVLYKLGQP